MARPEARKKMGYYPTPVSTMRCIKSKIKLQASATLIDPCCGEGHALSHMAYKDEPERAESYGIEPDTQRVTEATCRIDNLLSGSIYDAIIRPLESFSLLYLNPPYDWEKGERMEFLFLKQSHKWLQKGGVLVYLVPEHCLSINKITHWIGRRYEHIRVYRFTKEDYPLFKQVALFGIKRAVEADEGEFPKGSYPHIEDSGDDLIYTIPPGKEPAVFELKGISEKDIHSYKPAALQNLFEAIHRGSEKSGVNLLSPIFPLRKGHLVSLLMSGVLNGDLKTKGNHLVFKCFTERSRSTRTEKAGQTTKEITLDTYISGIRVIERSKWYDVL